ncbi:MAG: hypothetical protein P8Y61_07700 [Gammaproteobacteria bacterium]|jgi:hypothetical protein
MRYTLSRLMIKAARVVTVVFVLAAMALSISATAEDNQDVESTPECGTFGVAETRTTFII